MFCKFILAPAGPPTNKTLGTALDLQEIAGDDREARGVIRDAAQAWVVQERVGAIQEELQRELVEEVHLPKESIYSYICV